MNTVGTALERLARALADPDRLVPLIQAAVLVIAGLLLARVARGLIRRMSRGTSVQSRVLMQRTASYLILGIFFVSAMRQFGFDFTVLLGAAGILTAAAAFASQTSASNVISGLFLGLERSVEIGDIITVSGVTGEVLSIDLLSTRLRTFDNLLVRIPNETMVKTEITNLNRFPIRRYDLRIGVAYKEDLARVRNVLLEVADRNPLCLEEPAPMIISQGYGASSVDFQLSVWARREAYLQVRNQIHQQVKEAFDREDIEIPFPQMTMHPPRAAPEEPAEGADEAPGRRTTADDAEVAPAHGGDEDAQRDRAGTARPEASRDGTRGDSGTRSRPDG